MIGIIDYGSGNIFSVSNALKKINVQNVLIQNPSEIEKFSTIILPGVGNFKSCMAKFKEKDFLSYTLKHASKGKKLIGICVGMQMLLEYSEENGRTDGLSLINGNVTLLKPNQNEFKKKLRLPNMGWSTIKVRPKSIGSNFFHNIDKLDYYFAHSYACRLQNKSYEAATNTYGAEEYSSVLVCNNIIGIQFHPEKSGKSGIQLLKNILNGF
jgi:glutamine amidotransferase